MEECTTNNDTPKIAMWDSFKNGIFPSSSHTSEENPYLSTTVIYIGEKAAMTVRSNFANERRSRVAKTEIEFDPISLAI